jgi:TIR domain
MEILMVQARRSKAEGARTVFKAFLSHRYRSPEINTYFFRLFAERAQVQFSIDRGTMATNVTRLERLVRDADAFIGLHSFPREGGERPRRAELETAAQYFNLELDLAIRSRKPAIVFVDSRYGAVIDPPSSIMRCDFDWQEVTSPAPSARTEILRQRFREFCSQVDASLAYVRARKDDVRTKVAILLPPVLGPDGGYDKEHLHVIQDEIRDTGADPTVLPWPPRLDSGLASTLDQIDWAVVDLGEQSTATGIVAYLHGRFIPCVRLIQTPPSEALPPVATALFGAHKVGYPKDIVRWTDAETLQSGMRARIQTIIDERRHIGTIAEAEAYFQSAALRKEAVFVSYSGKDRDLAGTVVSALKRKFQEVFDYQDGAAITAGTPWMKTIFERLSVAPISVPLLSANYFQSKNCEHEALQIMARHDEGRMHVIPIKLYDKELALPPWIESLQYLRLWTYEGPDATIKALVDHLEKLQGAKTGTP